nr:hypothetical protein [Candidatus Sigynarchaeota archaeon]
QILIHAIHSHAGLDLTGEYYWPGGLGNTVRSIMFGIGRNDRLIVWMACQIVKMVGQLLQDLQPAKIAWAKTAIKDHVIYNRRHHLAKPYRADLGVICFKHAETNELFGVIVNFGAHPTILPNTNYKLSAEWPGRLVARIEALSGIKAVFFQDAAGDISPSYSEFRRLYKRIRQKYGKRKRIHFHVSEKIREEGIENYGWKIGEPALALAKSIPEDQYFDRVEVKIFVRSVWFPIEDYREKYGIRHRIENRFWHLSKKYFLLPLVFSITDAHEPNFPGLAVKHRGLINVQCYSKLQYIRIKAIDSKTNETRTFNIIGMPGEPVRHYGRSLQRKTPEGFENSFLFEMCNDWMAYLFDFSEYTYGGGEPMESLAPVAGKFLKQHFIQFIADIEAGLTTGNT